MKKFNALYTKIVEDSYEWDKIIPIFEKEAPELINKLNDRLKKFGLESYFTLGRRYFSDGHKQKAIFNAVGDKKGKEWWEWCSSLENTETKNLVYKSGELCLKKSWRPTSHRGQININNIH